MRTNSTITAIHAGQLSTEMNFQQRVWAVTARIPRGKVATYAWVARQLKSTAYRAVGRALGQNPYAPAVPCHRVVGSNGMLTGYAGGLPAKRRLLHAEGVEIKKDRINLTRFAVA